MGLPRRTCVERTVFAVETYSPVKKTSRVQRSVNIRLTVFLVMKVTITIDFLEKDATVNNANCRLL